MCYSLSNAQNESDFTNLVKRINNYYYNPDFEVTYKLLYVMEVNDGVVNNVDSVIYNYSILGTSSIAKYEDITMLVTNKFYVSVIEEEHAIILGRNSNGLPSAGSAINQLQSMVAKGELKITDYHKTNQDVDITLDLNDQTVDSLHISVNDDTGLLHSVSFYTHTYDKGKLYYQKSHLIFSNQNKRELQADAHSKYELNYYVSIDDKNVRPNPKFKTYQIYNNLIY